MSGPLQQFTLCPFLHPSSAEFRIEELKWGLNSYGKREEEYFRCLMDLLHINIYLEVVDIGHIYGGKKVLVQEALRRNKQQATYFSTLRDAKVAFGKAKAARVFLCGDPHAGKSTLRVSMMKTSHKESRIMKHWSRKFGSRWRNSGKGKYLPLKRTKGVDVELLRDDDQMQISIWDLAGQEIFRALQSLLLPAVTQACIFVFVFSPFHDDQRFGRITHEDKMKQNKMDLGCSLAPIVDHFRAEYRQALNLHATPFHVDAWNEDEVNPFVENLYVIVSEMLQKKTPEAPSVFYRLISEILDPHDANSRQMVAAPVWGVQGFLNHISKSLEALNVGSFDQGVADQRTVLEAAIQYMHDVGSIFYLPKCQLVVVDINWLTHKFLGYLISEGHGFQVKSHARTSFSEDGVVTKGTLDSHLEKLSQICRKKEVNVDPEVLKDLLVYLDLCYSLGSVQGVQEYFMPTIFGRSNARDENQILTWGTAPSSDTDWQYFGYRLVCKDTSTTALTAAMFPRFQIRFRK
ncbi:hypothetical protein R1sor_005294 [Riccia sorocarpa]|uniref:C-terminal of Roc (COR) domain-containing protein n=1 Tax=Riccia sorocarpa TaxID=122646 RepID=A0ABD3HJL9_9MARC